MLKTEFGDDLKAKNEHAQFDEALLNVLCHNIVVVIHGMKESDVDPGFLSDMWRPTRYPDPTSARKPLDGKRTRLSPRPAYARP